MCNTENAKKIKKDRIHAHSDAKKNIITLTSSRIRMMQ